MIGESGGQMQKESIDSEIANFLIEKHNSSLDLIEINNQKDKKARDR